jgi:hypothetical protein
VNPNPGRTSLLNFPFYSILFAIFPVVSYWGVNIGQVPDSSIWRLLIAAATLGLLLLLCFRLALSDWQRAGLAAALSLIVFFSYGQLYTWLATIGSAIGHHRYLFPLFVLVEICFLLIIFRTRALPPAIPTGLNGIAVLLFIFPLSQIATYQIHTDRASRQVEPGSHPTTAAQAQLTPDIYYIILDMYARDDLLLNEMGYDNSTFLTELKNRGFYVAECTLSNYTQTELSLASTLNMEYLDTLGSFPADSTDRTQLDELILHSRVRTILEHLGYQTVSLSAYGPLKLPDADVFFDTTLAPVPTSSRPQIITAFESVFIKTTILRVYLDSPWAKKQSLAMNINYPYGDHVREQLYILNTLPTLPQVQSPKFVFIHIQLPHPPFVFTEDGGIVPDPPPFPAAGQIVPREIYVSRYLAQVTYLNSRILPIIDTILSSSSVRPVIILQGDHGPYSITIPNANYPAILNAYYLPGSGEDDLYPEISPVNSFRLILDYYFGQELPLYEDHSYLSTYKEPFKYIEIVNTRPGCK